jgi:hypothetical protein
MSSGNDTSCTALGLVKHFFLPAPDAVYSITPSGNTTPYTAFFSAEMKALYAVFISNARQYAMYSIPPAINSILYAIYNILLF